MHRFRGDDQAVLFLDYVGLTRVNLPNHVKTDRRINGGWDTVVSLDDRGANALVQDAEMEVHVYPFPALTRSRKNVRAYGRRTHLLGDGRRMLVDRTVRTLAGVEPMGRVADERVKRLKPLALWETTDFGACSPFTFARSQLAHGSIAFVTYTDRGWELAWGRCDGSGGRLRWRRSLRMHGGRRHQLFPHERGLVITACSPAARRVYVTWLDEQGAQTDVLEADGCAAPVWAFGRLAWQADDDTIFVREPDRTRRAYSIGATVFAARSAAKRKREGGALGASESAGVGSLLLGPRSLLFVPWHRETILDLSRGVELHRKLSPKDEAPRRAFARAVRHAASFAREADIALCPDRLEVHARRREFNTNVELTRGEGNIVSALVGGAATSLFMDTPATLPRGDWSWSGYAIGFHHVLDSAPGTLEQLLRAFSAFDQHRVHLCWAAQTLVNIYEGSRRRALTRDAEKLLMQALLASLADVPRTFRHRPRPTWPSFRLLDRVEEWRDAELTRAAFLRRARAVQHDELDEKLLDLLARSYFGAARDR